MLKAMIPNRRLLAPILIPTILITIGMTLGNAFIPLYARKLGASMATAALVSSLFFLGQAAADLPVGWLVHHFGEKRNMAGGGILTVLAMVLRIAATDMMMFTASVILFGVGISLIWIAQMSWLKKEIGGRDRGHAMSMEGGALRLARILGPLAGGFLAENFGYRVLFGIQGIFCLSAVLVILFAIPHTPGAEGSYARSLETAAARWKSGRTTILAAGVGLAGLMMLRASRDILIPLWGGELGLNEARIGIVMFTGAAVDTALFWISGIIMTRSGRKTAAIACTTGLALAIALLPLARSFPALMLLSALAGLGNAMGAGINLAISGDLAPGDSPVAFMSIWRFFMGFAGFGGPALAALMIGIAGNASAPPVAAATGFMGALLMFFFMKDTTRK